MHDGFVDNRRPGALSSLLSLTSASAGSGSCHCCRPVFGLAILVVLRRLAVRGLVRAAGEGNELKPGQRDGHSEIGDPPEAAAGGGQEPVGGEDPWGRGALATEELFGGTGAGWVDWE